MSFKKDGEIKVYVSKHGKDTKQASEDKKRYTIDDLVRDSELTTNLNDLDESTEEMDEDVSD